MEIFHDGWYRGNKYPGLDIYDGYIGNVYTLGVILPRFLYFRRDNNPLPENIKDDYRCRYDPTS